MNIFTHASLPDSPKVRQMNGDERMRSITSIIQYLVKTNCERRGPFVLILENIQWIDLLSWHVLSKLCKSVTHGVVVILTMRPTVKLSKRQEDLLSGPNGTLINLQPLAQAEIEQLCCVRLGISSLPIRMSELICVASNGNPLFVLELLASFKSAFFSKDKKSILNRPKTRGFGESISEFVSVSTNIQSIMTSRIDKLPPRQQEILKTASVFGVEFPIRLLTQVCRFIEPEDVDRELRNMETDGLIVTTGIDPDVSGAYYPASLACTLGLFGY
jgi:predicted ATPase